MTKEQIEAIIKDIEHYVYDTDLYDVENILEKHLQPSKSVEELIEKRNNELDKAEKEKELISYPRVIIGFIQDLQSLQPTTEEREVEIKQLIKEIVENHKYYTKEDIIDELLNITLKYKIS